MPFGVAASRFNSSRRSSLAFMIAVIEATLLPGNLARGPSCRSSWRARGPVFRRPDRTDRPRRGSSRPGSRAVGGPVGLIALAGDQLGQAHLLEMLADLAGDLLAD